MTQVDPRSAPEVTTAVDKEGIVELLNTSDADLKDDAPALAAKTVSLNGSADPLMLSPKSVQPW